MVETIISTKGQIVLPKEVRAAKKWPAGTRLEVIDRPEGVMLKPKVGERPYTIDDVVGCLRKYYKGPAISIEDMDRRAKEGFAKEWRKKEKRARDDRG
jgi:AbrB family looped-hinge helix DNA binding protein